MIWVKTSLSLFFVYIIQKAVKFWCLFRYLHLFEGSLEYAYYKVIRLNSDKFNALHTILLFNIFFFIDWYYLSVCSNSASNIFYIKRFATDRIMPWSLLEISVAFSWYRKAEQFHCDSTVLTWKIASIVGI